MVMPGAVAMAWTLRNPAVANRGKSKIILLSPPSGLWIVVGS